jgi:hypothetical protein
MDIVALGVEAQRNFMFTTFWRGVRVESISWAI